MKKELKAIASTLQSTVSRFWDIVFTPPPNELRIWQKRDQFGKTYWCIMLPSAIAPLDLPLNKE